MKTTRHAFLVIITLALFLALMSCAAARYVLLEANRGVVGMPSNSRLHRDKALKLIAERCPNGYDIIREEEVPIGQIMRGETEVSRGAFPGVQEDYRVYTRTEWRISFTCK